MTDWIKEAAYEIDSDKGWETIMTIIQKHLPRCGTCKYWLEFEPHEGRGKCNNDAVEIMTNKNFGCMEWESK